MCRLLQRVRALLSLNPSTTLVCQCWLSLPPYVTALWPVLLMSTSVMWRKHRVSIWLLVYVHASIGVLMVVVEGPSTIRRSSGRGLVVWGRHQRTQNLGLKTEYQSSWKKRKLSMCLSVRVLLVLPGSAVCGPLPGRQSGEKWAAAQKKPGRFEIKSTLETTRRKPRSEDKGFSAALDRQQSGGTSKPNGQDRRTAPVFQMGWPWFLDWALRLHASDF